MYTPHPFEPHPDLPLRCVVCHSHRLNSLHLPTTPPRVKFTNADEDLLRFIQSPISHTERHYIEWLELRGAL